MRTFTVEEVAKILVMEAISNSVQFVSGEEAKVGYEAAIESINTERLTEDYIEAFDKLTA